MSKETLNITLTKKQGELLRAFLSRVIIEILFGGGGRGGKTWGVCELIVLTAIQYPGIVWLVGRREWEDLRKSTLVTLQKVLRKRWLVQGRHYTLNLQTKELHFYNWSKIFFIPLKLQPSDPEFDFLGGYEGTFSFVDEAQEVARKAIDVLKTRLTEKIVEYDLIPKIILGCNPRKWHLYQDFIKPTKDGTLAKDRIFIPALYKDNPHINHALYEAGFANADKVTRERILHGNWDYDDRPYKLFSYDAITDIFTNPSHRGERYIIGDVAGEGKDRGIIAVFDGYEVIDYFVFAKCTPEQYQDKVREFAERYGIPMSRTLLDQDGIGWGIVGNLHCKGFQNGSSPIDNRTEKERAEQWGKPLFQNLKTQCYFELQKIIEQSKLNVAVMAQYREEIIQELDEIEEVDVDKEWPRKITPKDVIKANIGRSPDFGDVFAMRMWFDLIPEKPKKKLRFNAI